MKNPWKFINPSLLSISIVASAINFAQAAEVVLVSGAVGKDIEVLKEVVKPWEKSTGNKLTVFPMPASTTDQFGQYRLWLAAGNADIDVYQTDVIWAPQLANNFVDLTPYTRDIVDQHFPSIIESQTTNGKLIALPIFTDAPALFYRKDLLKKYNKTVPNTWEELTETAKYIQTKEREAGNPDMWGFVWQGNAYEGLTCDALEWVKSFGGGQIVEADGTISINNPKAVEALKMAKSWIGDISPAGVLAYQEEDARGVWQTGNAVFMRNWPYAYALGNSEESAIKDKFGAAPLPSGTSPNKSAATLGGWNVAVSKYSKHKEASISLVKYLASEEVQKYRALHSSNLPTIISLYDDKDIKEQQPIIAQWKDVFLHAVPRPSAPTKIKYNEVSSKFFSAVHSTLAGSGSAEENLELLEYELETLKGNNW
ncbi:carbohydrate ABC transporter substrate-binding protein, CUT1 family [Marinomonas polaris DSM 16579]|uniref:Carbohydrate ABC transporter substrate-binding protein, CUT1 family n=1 Tax=Marinomonas polaris DSM 16579 TaxID=1122206 RepID=A0A1M5ARI7_9GAMM|nr:ABC transporter substrate-binding protein [Marinomonas polaris]SHF32863.1 carbohydrate ABC transporter substrate-binding protein, CUT1 family [Marinomonas polaris DSM 16579]